MSQTVLGILAIVAGAVFCFRGYLALRSVIGVWGAFVGFGLGAALVALLTGEPPLAGLLGWVGAIVGALLLGGLAYTFYAVAVILTMGSVGYALGSGAAALFTATPWVVVVAGLVGAAILVAAVGGASAIVAGIALLMGVLPLSGAEPDTLAQALSEHWWLNVAYLVLLVVGIVTQLRHRSTADLRASYR